MTSTRESQRLRQAPKRRARGAVLSALIAALVVPGTAAAQGAPPTFEFSFSNPGARSLGLGGAFVALADDATAAFANPAGLVQLLRPEVSIEGRHWSFTTPYTSGGRASGTPTGIGIDTEPGLLTARSSEEATELSFLSLVYPGREWSVALHRHQLAKFAMRFELNGLFAAAAGGGTRRAIDELGFTEFDITTTALSGAWRVSERFSIGLGVAHFDGTVDSSGSEYLLDEYPTTFYELNSFLPERRYSWGVFELDGTDWGLNVGFLWSFTERWKLGAVFREGPDFRYDFSNFAGPAHELPEGSDLGSVSGRTIAFPDVYGLGLSYRSADGRVTVGFEWDRVEYSSILESLSSEIVDTTDVVLDDADELHLGFEHVFLRTTPLLAVRVGGWLDPDHRIRFEGDDPIDRAVFARGEDTVHLTLGLGLAYESLQIDVGVDLSKTVDTASVSAIYSF